MNLLDLKNRLETCNTNKVDSKKRYQPQKIKLKKTKSKQWQGQLSVWNPNFKQHVFFVIQNHNSMSIT